MIPARQLSCGRGSDPGTEDSVKFKCMILIFDSLLDDAFQGGHVHLHWRENGAVKAHNPRLANPTRILVTSPLCLFWATSWLLIAKREDKREAESSSASLRQCLPVRPTIWCASSLDLADVGSSCTCWSKCAFLSQHPLV